MFALMLDIVNLIIKAYTREATQVYTKKAVFDDYSRRVSRLYLC